jgi:RNA polymerase primary sigma factor
MTDTVTAPAAGGRISKSFRPGPVRPVNGHTGASRHWRPLAPPVERALVLAARRGDPAARSKLVEAYTGSIARLAAVYRGARAVDHADLMQQGIVGLLQALARYDPEVGTPFWAYASWWVRREMQEMVADLSRPTAMSDRALRQLMRVKRARHEHLQAQRREPSTAELVAATGLRSDRVEALVAVDRPAQPLEEPPHADPHGSSDTFRDLLADPRSQDDYDRVERRLEADELRLRRDALGERERIVLRARFGFDGPERTLREIGHELRLSPERVRQIHEQALDQLRSPVQGEAA